MITHGELFAGIGGFGSGFAAAGIVTQWSAEINKQCQQVLRAHNPNTPIFSDIRDCGAHNLEPVDIISFGSPCQSFSVAGDRRGLDGEKSSIISEAFRVVRELKPTFAVWENVTGALSSNSGRDFAAILTAFQECGAVDIAYRVLDARYWGVPQRRRRIFLVADFREKRAGEILFESDRSAWDFTPSTAAGTRIAAPIKASSPSRRGGGSWPITELIAFDTTQITSRHNRSNPQVGDPCHPLCAAAHAPVIAFKWQQGASAGGLGISKDVAPTLGVTQVPAVIAFDWQSGGDVRLNISEDHTSALQASQTPAVQTRYGVRRLMPIECERLQGFPKTEKCVIIDVCLDHQRNYAGVEIRSRKSPRLVGNVGKTGSLEPVRFAARNLNTRSQPEDKHAPPLVDINCGERTVVIHSQGRSLLSVNIAESGSEFPLPVPAVDFAHLLVGLTSIVERIISSGTAGSQANGGALIHHQNGKRHVKLSGSGITQCVKDVVIDLTTHRKLLKSIMSGPLNTKNAERELTILCSYVLSVITGYILPEILNANSFRIKITTELGWTAVDGMSDTARYRMLGNAVCRYVVEWLGKRIVKAVGT